MDVLVAEDEPLVALNLEVLLQEHGYTVIGAAATAKAAMALAAAHRPQAALLDLNLADGLRGLELAEHLALIYDTTIVILTGNPNLVPPGLAYVHAVLTKPSRDEQVLQVLARIGQERAGEWPAVDPRHADE